MKCIIYQGFYVWSFQVFILTESTFSASHTRYPPESDVHWQVLVTANLTMLPGPLISLSNPKCLKLGDDFSRWR